MTKKIGLVLLIWLSMMTFVVAQEEGAAPEEAADAETEGEEAVEQLPIRYFQISPNIMTFYQSPGTKIGYIVVQVQIVVRGDDNLEALQSHIPLMQDALTDLFNRQTKEVVQDLSQRETLRKQAEERISEVIESEVGSDIVEDVLFTQYIFQ